MCRYNKHVIDSHNLTALMPRCMETSFLMNPHYLYAHRNSDNLHAAASKGYSLLARGIADEQLIVVLYQIVWPKTSNIHKIW